MKSLWNGEIWDRVETKEYRVSEENGESKKNWTRKENDHGEVNGSVH